MLERLAKCSVAAAWASRRRLMIITAPLRHLLGKWGSLTKVGASDKKVAILSTGIPIHLEILWIVGYAACPLKAILIALIRRELR
jgi:hypothetical protein